MQAPDAGAIARLLAEYGQLSALSGGNAYRAKAYQRAAESLLALTVPIDQLVLEDRLTQIPGVGAAIADTIKTIYTTGSHPKLEALRRAFPAGILQIHPFLGCGQKVPSSCIKLWVCRT